MNRERTCGKREREREDDDVNEIPTTLRANVNLRLVLPITKINSLKVGLPSYKWLHECQWEAQISKDSLNLDGWCVLWTFTLPSLTFSLLLLRARAFHFDNMNQMCLGVTATYTFKVTQQRPKNCREREREREREFLFWCTRGPEVVIEEMKWAIYSWVSEIYILTVATDVKLCMPCQLLHFARIIRLTYTWPHSQFVRLRSLSS